MSNEVPLFEKLIDEDIEVPFEKNPKRTSSLAEFQEYIIDDLTKLLNTRVSVYWREFAEKNYVSPFAYGINITPDISTENVESLTELETRIRTVIEQFEPRLTNIEVHAQVSTNDPSYLFVNIDAIVLFEDRKAPLSFPVVIKHQ